MIQLAAVVSTEAFLEPTIIYYNLRVKLDRTKEIIADPTWRDTWRPDGRIDWSSSHLAPPDARKKSKRTGYNHILAAHPFSTLSNQVFPFAPRARDVGF